MECGSRSIGIDAALPSRNAGSIGRHRLFAPRHCPCSHFRSQIRFQISCSFFSPICAICVPLRFHFFALCCWLYRFQISNLKFQISCSFFSPICAICLPLRFIPNSLKHRNARGRLCQPAAGRLPLQLVLYSRPVPASCPHACPHRRNAHARLPLGPGGSSDSDNELDRCAIPTSRYELSFLQPHCYAGPKSLNHQSLVNFYRPDCQAKTSPNHYFFGGRNTISPALTPRLRHSSKCNAA